MVLAPYENWGQDHLGKNELPWSLDDVAMLAHSNVYLKIQFKIYLNFTLIFSWSKSNSGEQTFSFFEFSEKSFGI